MTTGPDGVTSGGQGEPPTKSVSKLSLAAFAAAMAILVGIATNLELFFIKIADGFDVLCDRHSVCIPPRQPPPSASAHARGPAAPAPPKTSTAVAPVTFCRLGKADLNLVPSKATPHIVKAPPHCDLHVDVKASTQRLANEVNYRGTYARVEVLANGIPLTEPCDSRKAMPAAGNAGMTAICSGYQVVPAGTQTTFTAEVTAAFARRVRTPMSVTFTY